MVTRPQGAHVLCANIKPAHFPFDSKVMYAVLLEVPFAFGYSVHKVTLDTVALLGLGLGSV